jgi:hypothetical protein
MTNQNARMMKMMTMRSSSSFSFSSVVSPLLLLRPHDVLKHYQRFCLGGRRAMLSSTAKVWIDQNTKVICQGFTGKQVQYSTVQQRLTDFVAFVVGSMID